MLSRFLRLLFFFFTISLILPVFSYAGQPGINTVNQIGLLNGLDPQVTNWILYIPETPENLDLNIGQITSANVVIRLSANWNSDSRNALSSDTGTQQALASRWAAALNKLAATGKTVYAEPFNEFEREEDETSGPEGQLGLTEALRRGKLFIGFLKSALAGSSVIVTSPAIGSDANPDTAKVIEALKSEFQQADVISYHPYRPSEYTGYAATLASHGISGKKYIFTETGILENIESGPAMYTDCAFIYMLCNNKTASTWMSDSNILAYMLFAMAPGDAGTYSGWVLTNPDVTTAMQAQCDSLDVPASHTNNDCKQKVVYKPAPFTNASSGVNAGLPITEKENWIPWFKNTADTPIKSYFTQSYLNGGNAPVDPYDQAKKPSCIAPDDMTRIDNPPDSIINYIRSIEGTGHNVSADGDQVNSFDYPAPNYNEYEVNGAGQAATALSPWKTINQVNKGNTNFLSGSLVRSTPYQYINDTDVDSWLCRLAHSNTQNAVINCKSYQLVDYAIGFLGDATDQNYTKSLPQAATVLIDRGVTNIGKPNITVRASDIYCAKKPACSDADFAPGITFDNTPNCANAVPLSVAPNCSTVVDPNHPLSVDQQAYCAYWKKLKMAILVNQENIASKAVFSRTVENIGITGYTACNAIATKLKVPLITKDLLDLKNDPSTANLPDEIINIYGGNFVIFKNGICSTGNAKAFLIPGLTQAAQGNKEIGCKWTASYTSIQKGIPIEKQISLNDKPPIEDSQSLAPLGIDNTKEIIDISTFSPILKFFQSFVESILKTPDCNISWFEQVVNEVILHKYPTSFCEKSAPAKVETILWLSKATQEAYYCSHQLNTNLSPNSTNQANKDNPLIYHGINTDTFSLDPGGLMGAKEMSDNNLQNSDAFGSTDRKKMPVYTGPSDLKNQEERTLQMTPLYEQEKNKRSSL